MTGIDKLKAILANKTPEEKLEQVKLAQEAMKAKAEQRKANEHLLKLDYADMNYWLDLASKHKIRMPYYNEPCSVRIIRKYLKKCNVPTPIWNDHYTSMDYFVKNNANWTAVATTGLILELKEEYDV